MANLPKSTYQERRRIVAALLMTCLATLGDISAENGSGLPIISAFGFYFVLTAGPLVIGRVLDIIADSKEPYDEFYDQDKDK